MISEREPRLCPPGRPTEALELFGDLLRQLRQAKGLSLEDVGRHIGNSPSKISRIEGGHNRISDDDLHALLKLYGVILPHETQAIVEFASRLSGRQWWHGYSDLLDGWLSSYLALESVAWHIRTYEMRFVPGLLQTRAYAEALSRRHFDEEQVRRRVDLRMHRQRVFLQRERAQLWAVIDRTALEEAALPNGLAGPDVMREQIEFLIRAIHLPNVRVQILPPGAGGRLGIGNSFSFLRLRTPILSEVTYFEHIGTAQFLTGSPEGDPYSRAMTQLAFAAGQPAATSGTLREILDDIRR